MAKSQPLHNTAEDWGGPYVGMAFLCQNVHVDETRTPTFERVADSIAISGPGQVWPLRLVVGVRAGDKTGPARCTVDLVFPGGERGPRVLDETKPYSDGDGITQWQVQVDFETELSGVYWFEVKINDRLVTKMPLTVSFKQLEQLH